MSEEQALDELDLLIQEYDPEQSDWRFRKSVMMKLIDRIRPATLRCSAESAASMRGALEKIATRKVIRYGDYLRCHTCGYKSVAPHTEERHAPNCARQLALAALSDPVLTEPQTAMTSDKIENMLDRIVEAAVYYEQAVGIYNRPAKTELQEAKAAVREVLARHCQADNVNFIAPIGTCAICKKPPAADCAICASIALTRPLLSPTDKANGSQS